MEGITNATEEFKNNPKNLEQLVNYTMLYDYGDECIDVTGGWEAIDHHDSYTPTVTITKNTDNIYTTQSGSGLSGPTTKNNINTMEYKSLGTVLKCTINSATWARCYLVNAEDAYNTYIISNGTITTPKFYCREIGELTNYDTYQGIIIDYTGNITMYAFFLLKSDNIQGLIERANIAATTIDEILVNSEIILNNENAVNYMIKQCTGDFMAMAIQNSAFLTALNNSPYASLIYANEHWAKFLNMVV